MSTIMRLLLFLSLCSSCMAGTSSWGGRTPATATAGRYFYVDSVDAGSATEAYRTLYVSVPGKITKLWFWAGTAPGAAGKSWTAAVRIAGSSMADLTATIENAAVSATATDPGGGEAFSANQAVTLYITSANSPAASVLYWWIDYVLDSGDGQIIGNTEAVNLSTTVSNYIGLKPGSLTSTSSGFARQFTASCPGNITNLHGKLSAAPGAGATRHFTLYVNSLPQVLDKNFTATDTEVSDDTNSVAINQNDEVMVVADLTGTPAAAWYEVSIAFTPTDPGEFMLIQSDYNVLTTDASRWLSVSSGKAGPDDTESDVSMYMREMTITDISIALSGSPGAGKSYTFDLQVGGVDSSPELTAVVEDATTFENASATVNITTGQLIDTLVLPTGTPTARIPLITYTAEIPAAAPATTIIPAILHQYKQRRSQ